MKIPYMKKFSDQQHSSLEEQSLNRMLAMRNLLIAGEVAAVVIFVLWQGELPNVTALVLLWLAMAAWNTLTYLKAQKKVASHDSEALLQISFDIAAFTVFLYFTGGATNPLGWYYLVPIMISATLLPKNHTLAIAVACILLYLLLFKYYLPLPGFAMDEHAQHAMPQGTEMDSAFSLHIFGMWFGFAVSALLVAWFVVDLARALRDRDENLALARQQVMKDQQLVAMATLATGAAHELGTPLGTMMLVSENLHEEYPAKDYPELNSSLRIVDEQILRCKEALSLISATAGESHLAGGTVCAAGRYLDQLFANWQTQRKVSRLVYESQTQQLSENILADLTITQAITNILNNAADASPDYIEIRVETDSSGVLISVLDKGSGFPEDFRYKLGEELISSKEHGLGIGLLLTHATIHRIGGQIKFFNDLKSGLSCTQIRLPFVKESASTADDR